MPYFIHYCAQKCRNGNPVWIMKMIFLKNIARLAELYYNALRKGGCYAAFAVLGFSEI